MDEMESRSLELPKLLALMTKIHKETIFSPENGDFPDEKLESICTELNLTINDIIEQLSKDNVDFRISQITSEWKFVCLNLYCLQMLKNTMKKDDMLSVSQMKDLKNCVKALVQVGILQNINPNLPHFKPLRLDKIGIEDQYHMLKSTVFTLFRYSMFATLRYYLLTHVLDGLLVALYQLAYCPVKPPNQNSKNEFQMTEKFHKEVLEDQRKSREFIKTILNAVSPTIFLKELMFLFKANTPKWFKKAISESLTTCVKQTDGLENVFRTMLAGVYDDNATTWRIVEIVTQIVVNFMNNEGFDKFMTPQIHNLLKTGRENVAFEKLYASIVKALHPVKIQEAESLVNYMLVPLKELSSIIDNDYSKDRRILLAKDIEQSIRLIHYVFLDTKEYALPSNILTLYIGILFNIYVAVHDTNLHSLNSDLHEILRDHLKTSDRILVSLLFENFFFNFKVPMVLNFRQNLKITEENGLVIKFLDKNVKYNIVKSAHMIYGLCKSDKQLFFFYFGFLLNCLTQIDNYFVDISLLENEEEGNLSIFEKKLAVYEMLSILSVDGIRNNYFSEEIPKEVFDYFNQVFVKALKKGSHKNPTDTTFQLVFTIAMILEHVVNSRQYNLNELNILNSLEKISNETNNPELKSLLSKILNGPSDTHGTSKKDEIDETIEETFNESIPMKGHGLIALERFIRSKNPKAVERKQYIFNIFKQNLRNRDTYIYLSAIKGLASMCDLDMETVDMVLETLCDEYTEFPEEEFGPDASEMRLKIGEILVQISKKLGEMAPKYKAILLNTFLNGTKDDDHLIRASSLANLGEICQVLGYKLGPIVTEVLTCVHAVISTDKCSEPKRAAVLVIRQLLTGLGLDMLTILQGDILPIYRTLKFLYANDKDDVVVLQSQLALEELNENMKNLMLPQFEKNTPEKIVILK